MRGYKLGVIYVDDIMWDRIGHQIRPIAGETLASNVVSDNTD